MADKAELTTLEDIEDTKHVSDIRRVLLVKSVAANCIQGRARRRRT